MLLFVCGMHVTKSVVVVVVEFVFGGMHVTKSVLCCCCLWYARD